MSEKTYIEKLEAGGVTTLEQWKEQVQIEHDIGIAYQRQLNKYEQTLKEVRDCVWTTVAVRKIVDKVLPKEGD